MKRLISYSLLKNLKNCCCGMKSSQWRYLLENLLSLVFLITDCRLIFGISQVSSQKYSKIGESINTKTEDCSNIIIKQFSTSVLRPVGIKWRQQNGYPDNHTSRGILTDGPDYSYADGKPTPYTTGQRARIIKQQEYAERVTKLLQLIDKSKNAYKEKVAAEMQDKEKILGRKLKPKGKTLKTKAL